MNIYVGNLSYRLRENELRDEFEKFGTVENVRIVRDRETRRSKGFGFVEVPNDEEAAKMLSELNGIELDGRQLVVKEAQPRP